MATGLKPVQLPWGAGGQFATSGTGILTLGQGCLTYFSAWETAGSTAVVDLYDGDNNNGRKIIRYQLAANESTSEMYGLHWRHFASGLYVVTVSGAVAGTADAWVDHSCVEYNLSLYRQAKYAEAQFDILALELEGRYRPLPTP